MTALRSAALAAALFTLIPVLQPPADAQLPAAPDDRYAGLQWRFVPGYQIHHLPDLRVMVHPSAQSRVKPFWAIAGAIEVVARYR